MKYYIILIFLFACRFSKAQADLLNENFDAGLPSGWSHCSGNWEATPQWAIDSGALRESSGPYFGGVLNGIQLPPVDLTAITDPYLGFDLALAVIDTNVQFSVWFTTDSVCSPVWDTINNRYILDGWQLLSTHDTTAVAANSSWRPATADYDSISINLSSVSNAAAIHFCLVSDYMNVSADGVWFVDNVRIYSNTGTRISESAETSSFQIFPNPADRMVRFVPVRQIKNATLRITDITGRTVFQQSPVSSIVDIDVSEYNPGIYLFHCIRHESADVERFLVILHSE